MKVLCQEKIVKFSQRDYDSWLDFDKKLMPEKLIQSFKRDIAKGLKTKPEFHHFAANIVKIYLEKSGYTVLLSEMSGDEYKLWKFDKRIARYTDKEKYKNFNSTYELFRKNKIITQGGGEPDLFVFNDNEAFFIEAKRIGPGNYEDKLRDNQRVVIGLIQLYLNLDTYIYSVVFDDIKNYMPKEYKWNLSIQISKSK